MKRKHRARKPYVWVYLADWERDSWNGISYTGRVTAVPFQRVKFFTHHSQMPFSSRKHRARVERAMRRAFSRYRPPQRRRYLAML